MYIYMHVCTYVCMYNEVDESQVQKRSANRDNKGKNFVCILSE